MDQDVLLSAVWSPSSTTCLRWFVETTGPAEKPRPSFPQRHSSSSWGTSRCPQSQIYNPPQRVRGLPWGLFLVGRAQKTSKEVSKRHPDQNHHLNRLFPWMMELLTFSLRLSSSVYNSVHLLRPEQSTGRTACQEGNVLFALWHDKVTTREKVEPFQLFPAAAVVRSYLRGMFTVQVNDFQRKLVFWTPETIISAFCLKEATFVTS